MTDSGRPRSWMHARYYFLPQLVAVLIVSPLAWMALLDRVPPLALYDGAIIPSQVVPGQADVEVVWRARFSGRDCPGDTQREIIDSEGNLWPKLRRARGGVFHPSKENMFEGTVTTPPLDIPKQVAPGRARYQVTQFYYCNWLQRLWDWPTVHKSVPIWFEVREK